VSLSQEHKSELQGWLSPKLEEMLPEIVAGKFREAGTPSMKAEDPSIDDEERTVS
jgi:hypothetical protein